MQFLNILYPKEVKPSKIKKKLCEHEKQFVNYSICDIIVVKRWDFLQSKGKEAN